MIIVAEFSNDFPKKEKDNILSRFLPNSIESVLVMNKDEELLKSFEKNVILLYALSKSRHALIIKDYSNICYYLPISYHFEEVVVLDKGEGYRVTFFTLPNNIVTRKLSE
jgi:hypothetical protein